MRRLPLLVWLVMSMLILGGASWAASRSSTAVMTACVKKSDGSMRMVGAKARCKSTERKVTWNARGPKGLDGATGASGSVGSPGAKGDTGAVGEPGPVGAGGERGIAGAVGPQGPSGPTGNAGPQGLAGVNGADGVQGPRGEQGATGLSGAVGPRGEKGEGGEMGPAGPRGEQGSPGAPGELGAQGPVGPAGPAGASVLVSVPVAAGQAIEAGGNYLASITLDRTKNYLVTAGITATAAGNGSLQCQLLRSGVDGWDQLAEIDLSTRSTVNLEHVYRAQNGISDTPMTVYLACLSASFTYTVDVGHLNALQITTVNSSGTSQQASRSLPSLRWSS